MAQINDIIQPQSFEIIRNRIAEILIDEIANQYELSYDEDLNATVYLERFVPYDKSELPAISVIYDNGNYDGQTQEQSDGVYNYFIDVYTSAKSGETEDGDSIAKFRLHKLLGICRAILENPKYKTLGFAPPFVMRNLFSSMKIAKPAEQDAMSVVMGRLIFSVKLGENTELITPELIAGYDTQVKMGLTDKGYIFSGNNIPVPPVTGGTVTLNDVSFGTVEIGEVLNVEVYNANDNERVGEKVGGAWLVSAKNTNDELIGNTVNEEIIVPDVNIKTYEGDDLISTPSGKDKTLTFLEEENIKSILCELTPSLTAAFSADDTTPTPNQIVTFTDETTGGTPTAWIWDFGDGNTSYVQNPTHEYELPGIYTIKLTVYSGSELGDIEIKTNYITIADDAAYFTERLTSQIQGDPSVYPPRDGGMLAVVNGKPRHINGWNGSAPSIWGSVVTNQEQWESSDGGYTFAKIADTGAGRRHSQNYVDTGFEIGMWGGDLFDSPQTNKKDSWVLNKTTGKWVQRATDMGAVWASRVLAASWHDGEYYYSAGGQDDYLGTTMFTNVIRSADLTADSWSVVGTLPISYFSTGQVVYIKDGQYKGAAYLIGGFRYNNGGIGDNYNTGIYKTTDNGANWTLVATLPDSMRASYINCWYKDGRIFFLHGNYISTNQQGLFFITPSTLEGGGSWTSVYSTTFTNYNTIGARHATPHCEFHDIYGDHVMLGNGNLWADMWAIRKVEYPIGVGTTYHPDATTYLQRMYNISQLWADIINEFITGCVTDGNWDKIVSLMLPCVDGHFRNALVNVKTPTRVAVNNGSVPWVAGQGFAPTGATGKSIRTGFNWLTDGVAAGITQDSFGHSIYSLTNSALARTSAGAYELGGTKDCSFAPKWSDNNAYIGLAGNGSVVKANSRSDGHILAIRTAFNAVQLFRQNASLGTSTQASQGLPNLEDYMCSVNNNGVAGSFDSRILAERTIFKGTLNVSAYYNRINTLMTKWGIVITA